MLIIAHVMVYFWLKIALYLVLSGYFLVLNDFDLFLLNKSMA
jgi:hypothetical protein